MDTLAPAIPAPLDLSDTSPLSENIVGGDGMVGVDVSTMVSSPIGLRQHAAAAFVSTIDNVSIASALCGFATVLKFPNVFGSVSVTVNTVVAFLMPLMVYGTGVVLE
jgi:hypothetical protein